MSDTTETETNTDNTDEPSKAELHDRVQQLESTVAKMMPSRRDALKVGAAGIAGAAGVAGASGSADASTGSAGVIGSSSDRPDAFLDEANVNQLTGDTNVANRQGCRVFLSSDQSISQSIDVKIQFDSKVYDSGSNFSTSSHNWTCPEDGIYAVNVQVRFVGGGDDLTRRVIIGTASKDTVSNEGAREGQESSDSFDAISASTINKYTSGDTIAAYVRNQSSNDVVQGGSGNFATFFEVAFLGGL